MTNTTLTRRVAIGVGIGITIAIVVAIVILHSHIRYLYPSKRAPRLQRPIIINASKFFVTSDYIRIKGMLGRLMIVYLKSKKLYNVGGEVWNGRPILPLDIVYTMKNPWSAGTEVYYSIFKPRGLPFIIINNVCSGIEIVTNSSLSIVIIYKLIKLTERQCIDKWIITLNNTLKYNIYVNFNINGTKGFRRIRLRNITIIVTWDKGGAESVLYWKDNTIFVSTGITQPIAMPLKTLVKVLER